MRQSFFDDEFAARERVSPRPAVARRSPAATTRHAHATRDAHAIARVCHISAQDQHRKARDRPAGARAVLT